MNKFWKIVLAVFVALILFSVISSIVLFSFIGSIAALTSAPKEVAVPQNAILTIDLEGTVVDRVNEEDFTALLAQINDDQSTLSIAELKKGLTNATYQPNIKAVYLNCGVLAAAPASVEEIRELISNFKEQTNLPIYAYGEQYSQSAYWIATLADSIYLNPYGTVGLIGFSMRPTFMKKALDKIGVGVQVYKVGTFKSAVEPYIMDHMSDANREQLTVLVSNLWERVSNDIADGRNVEIAKLNAFIEEGGFAQDGEVAMAYHLVDGLFYPQQMEAFLDSIGGGKHSKVNYQDIPKAKIAQGSVNRIAVLYALGDIDGSTGDGIVSEDVVEQLNDLAKNDKIKAVVLRINSPGGSAYGSEQMWYAAKQLANKKPLVISMGDYAASGGYYLSSAGCYIVAQPTTVTGSIGIFGLRPNVGELANNIGITFDVVKSHELSDFSDLTHPASAQESAVFQKSINKGYELFVSRCAEGRHMTTDAIKAIAEGRVWSGKDALRIGLVDELGGLSRAIEVAAQKAEIEDYKVVEYPKEKDLLTKLMESLNSMNMSVSLDPEQLLKQKIESMNGIQAIMPYSIELQ